MKDKIIIEFAHQMGQLKVEETGFILNRDMKVNEKGRTMSDVAKDMIRVYELTNNYLQSKYPDNEDIKAQIATNEFSLNQLKEEYVNA